MKKTLLILVLLPTCLFAQKQYSSIALGLDFPKGVDQVAGGYLTHNIKVVDIFYIGVGAGIAKFQDVPHAYYPLFLNLSFVPNNNNSVYPIVCIQPGYGLYKNDIKGIGTTNGGFIFFGGVGVGVNSGSRDHGMATIGYSHYTFSLGSTKSNFDGISLRLGAMLR